ncbi:MAG: hypothetical protein Q7T16_00680 [Candidatus Burarchaeum sp.]|nr:hypothetical protein [Candidatus Burarchaeum sp.]MDO8339152.1 hypothetical protein [Candidatus Burarchaeum sp.]
MAGETEITDAHSLLRNKLKMNVEPSSAAAFVALNRLNCKFDKHNVVVVVNTGRGLYFD